MSSRGKKAQTRKAKVAQLRAEQKQAERRRNILVRAGVTVAVVALVGWGVYAVVDNRETETIPGLVTADGLSRSHVEGQVEYPHSPPMGGDHAQVWLGSCGAYPETVVTEQAVHSMEHGAVWVTYEPGLAAGEISKLEELVEGGGKVFLSPWEGMETPIAISAWGRQLKVDDAADERLAQFIDAFEGSGPEPNAPC